MPITAPPQQTQAEDAYCKIEEMIVTLELSPGAMVTESNLVEHLKLGRTPIREALQRLAWESLVTIRARAGIMIAPLNSADWIKVLEARRGVEILLASKAALNLTPHTQAIFEDADNAMKSAQRTNDTQAFLSADKRFDLALAYGANNDFAARLSAPLQTHSRRFWFRHAQLNSLPQAIEGHRAVIKAIIMRDEKSAGQRADALMNTLIDMARAVQ